MKVLLLTLLLASPLPAQTWAQVELENGTLLVSRLVGGSVALELRGTRSWRLEWSPIGAAIATAALRVRAAQLPTDTVRYQDSTVAGTTTLRCAPVGCWITITHAGRAGYWRPRPIFDAALLTKLANVLEAARLGIGAFWIEDLR